MRDLAVMSHGNQNRRILESAVDEYCLMPSLDVGANASVFKLKFEFFSDTLIQNIFSYIKNSFFGGDLTDVSAKKGSTGQRPRRAVLRCAQVHKLVVV